MSYDKAPESQRKTLDAMYAKAGHDAISAMQAEIDALKAERDRLAQMVPAHPGNLHWLAEDPEYPLECWSIPVEERWEAAGTVFKMMAAVSLPPIFVTERVLTVDEHGDPDATEAVWFADKQAADRCYQESLAAARAALASTQEDGKDA